MTQETEGGHVRSSTINALAELLGTVVFVEEVVGDLLEVGEMTVEQSTSNSQEIRVSWVLNFDNTPRVLPGAYFPVVDLHKVLRANDGERHQSTQFRVLLHSVLVILLDIVREVVDRNTVVFDVFHNQFLGLSQFGGSKGIGLSDDGDDVNTGREALHQLDIEFTETMAGWCDEVQEDVHTVVPEAGVTLNPRFFGQDVVVLALEVSDNLTKANERVSPVVESWFGISRGSTCLASLSIWSPNPGVSTMVREIRVPSSSNSSSWSPN